jgi:hypothetical protein
MDQAVLKMNPPTDCYILQKYNNMREKKEIKRKKYHEVGL